MPRGIKGSGKAKAGAADSAQPFTFSESASATIAPSPALLRFRSKHPQYDAAMEARRNGTLTRKVLTELGWVTPYRPEPEV